MRSHWFKLKFHKFLVSTLEFSFGAAMSPAARFKRALVTLMLELARMYGLTLTLNRDSQDDVVKAGFRKVMKRAHPDKAGGSEENTKRLNIAWENWNKARKPNGRPSATNAPAAGGEMVSVPAQGRRKKEFRIQAQAVMLTYQGLQDISSWSLFLEFVADHLVTWRVKNWCATMEANKELGVHIHLMLQFVSACDRGINSFVFQKRRPNASTNDYLGEGLWGKRHQQSIDRGMFYVWADKVGTQRTQQGEVCVAGDYKPCWTESKKKYRVLGKWAFSLWQERKLTHEVYEEYLFQARDGVAGRKRNLDMVLEWEKGRRRRADIEARTAEIKSDPTIFQPFPDVPAAQAWLEAFKKRAVRYPIMVVVGKSHTGKTEWAQSLFKNPFVLEIGELTHFPKKMRSFDRHKHDGLVLDDLRDLLFLGRHQDKLQGKYNKEVEFATTTGGTCAYFQDLYKVPVVATVNHSTQNLDALVTHDFLALEKNRVVVRWPPSDFAFAASH